MRIFQSNVPPVWLEAESAVAVPLSTTHSVAVQLFTGLCAFQGGASSGRCRPECAAPEKDVCDGTPLGAGIAMCSRSQQIGPLATIGGTLIFPATLKVVNATGTTTNSKAMVLLLADSFTVFESDTTFLGKILHLDPATLAYLKAFGMRRPLCRANAP